MSRFRVSPSIWVSAAFAVLAFAVLKLPLIDAAALLIALIGFAVGLGLMVLVREAGERQIVTRLFLLAYSLRLAFAFVLYKSKFNKVLGGADDLGWIGSAYMARRWISVPQGGANFLVPPLDGEFPDTLWQLFTSAEHNSGYHYFGAWFFYLLGVNSQMAFAFFNCLAGALVVVLTYQAARLFSSRRASIFVAAFAMLLPSFITWSALTQKEIWVIFLEIAGFYLFWRLLREAKEGASPTVLAWFAGWLVVSVALLFSMRFYAAPVQVVGALVTWVCFRSQRPLRAALWTGGGLTAVFAVLLAAHVIRIDMASIMAEQIDQLENFHAGLRVTGERTNTNVNLAYDLNSPVGLAKMATVGSIYVFFSPFIWQMNSVRQFASLPDLLAWYFLFFGFVAPGFVALWRRNRAAVLSVVAYLVPLILFYSLTFGNVGTTFRMRSQLVPFFLVFAAAAYDKRRKSAPENVEKRLRAVLAAHLMEDKKPAPELEAVS